MVWNQEEPRAIKPPVNLLNSDVPVLSTETHALASPLPFGLGVYSVGPGNSKRPLPLYYVSEKVAASRGRSVKEGWYVVAVPGTQFELRITVVQQNFPHVNNQKLKDGHDLGATVSVDGRCANGAYYLFNSSSRCGEEIVVTGFREALVYQEGERHGREVIRKFAFRKTSTFEEGAGGTDSGTGCIRVLVFSGKRTLKALHSSSWKKNIEEKDIQVKEKEAVKHGKSIGVDRSGVTETLTSSRSQTSISKSKIEGSFTIFFREKFWMQSRHIIDSEGKLWVPEKDGDVIELATGDTEHEAADVKLGKRASSNNGSRKKLKREVVDLTKIQDSIDLTEE